MTGTPRPRRVAIFGGSGFLGSEIAQLLVSEGVEVRVAVRHPEKVRGPANGPHKEKIEQVYADVRDETSLAAVLEGCDAAVNAVGLYVENRAETFADVHEAGAANVARQCSNSEISSLVHMSGIGVDARSPSPYVRARARGERLARDAFPETTVLRPSVLFGPNDRFINTLANIIRRAPFVPLFGRGATKLQPVYVQDVAAATYRVLRDPATRGKTYELGGANTMTYRAILELIMVRLDKQRLMLPVPFMVWDIAAAVLSVLPASPITRDQIALMRQDNLVGESALSFSDLGIDAAALEDVLPDYAF